MKTRAVIFDVYGTLLEIGPGPVDAEERWLALQESMLAGRETVSLADFKLRTEAEIAREQRAARARGIAFPEVNWPDVAAKVLPELKSVSPATRERFIVEHMQLIRTVRLMPGALPVLRQLDEAGVILGAASNAQAYTFQELAACLGRGGRDWALRFQDTELSFWSFQHGFAKPDPRAFQMLTQRLQQRGIAAAQTLMVGDRLDTDIEPARAFGWQTWQLSAAPTSKPGGNWEKLGAWLRECISPTATAN